MARKRIFAELSQRLRQLSDGPVVAAYVLEGRPYIDAGDEPRAVQLANVVAQLAAAAGVVKVEAEAEAAGLRVLAEFGRAEGRGWVVSVAHSSNDSLTDNQGTTTEVWVLTDLVAAALDFCDRMQLRRMLPPKMPKRRAARAVPPRADAAPRRPLLEGAALTDWRRATVKDYLAKRGLTVTQLASEINATDRAVRAMIQGDRKCFGEATLQRLLNRLAVSRDEWNGLRQ